MQYTKSYSVPFLLTHSPHSMRWGIIQSYVLVQGIRRRVGGEEEDKGNKRKEGRGQGGKVRGRMVKAVAEWLGGGEGGSWGGGGGGGSMQGGRREKRK
jgi:hypothetical protein